MKQKPLTKKPPRDSIKDCIPVGVITILGFPVEVIMADMSEEDNDGECYAAEQQIYLSHSIISDELLISTLLHEATHFIINKTGLAALLKHKHEESLVLAIENALAPALIQPLYQCIKRGSNPHRRKSTTKGVSRKESNITTITHFLKVINSGGRKV